MTNFDTDRYQHLLDKKRIGELSYQSEKTEFLELLEFDRRVRDQYYYNKKWVYQQLLKDYASGKTGSYSCKDLGGLNMRSFAYSFSQYYQDYGLESGHEFKSYRDLTHGVQPISDGFSVHLDGIYEYCQAIVLRTQIMYKRIGSIGSIDEEFASEESSSREYAKRMLSRMAKYLE